MVRPATTAGLLALFGLGVLLLHYPAWSCDWLNWDDPWLVLNNAMVKAGAFGRMFTEPFAGLYHPLTLVSWGLEYAAFGPDARAFHATNVILHVGNCLLLWRLVWQLSRGNKTLAWVTAALFACHPLHVESVAWITERKDVLCGFWYLLCLNLYVKGSLQNRFSTGRYAAVTLSLVAALLSKPMAVSLPVVMVLIDNYLKRWSRPETARPRLILASAREKSAWFLLAGVAGVVNLVVQSAFSATNATEVVSSVSWVNAWRFLCVGISKAIWPFKLSFYYEVGAGAYDGAAVSLVVALLALMGVAYWAWPAWRAAARFGLGFFLVTVLPVMRLVQFGDRTMFNDRYVYLPGIGLYWLVATAALQWSAAAIWRQRVAVAVCAVVVAALAYLSWQRLAVFQTSETLWLDVLRTYPRSGKAAQILADLYGSQHRYGDAIPWYQRALELDSGNAMVYAGLADAQARSQQFAASQSTLAAGLGRFPDSAEIWHAQGVADILQKDYAAARVHLTRALQAKSSQTALLAADHQARVHGTLGLVLLMLGQYSEANAELALGPDEAFNHHNQALAFLAQRQMPLARQHFAQALAMTPLDADLWRDFAVFAWTVDDHELAVTAIKRAMEISPEGQTYRCVWREMLLRKGEAAAAQQAAPAAACPTPFLPPT